MLQKMESEVPDWEVSASKGNLSPVRSWLTDNVHSKGNLYDPADLISGITGKDLDVKPFLEYSAYKVSQDIRILIAPRAVPCMRCP